MKDEREITSYLGEKGVEGIIFTFNLPKSLRRREEELEGLLPNKSLANEKKGMSYLFTASNELVFLQKFEFLVLMEYLEKKQLVLVSLTTRK